MGDTEEPIDIPKLETEEEAAEKKNKRRWIKNNDTKPINNKTINFISSKTSR